MQPLQNLSTLRKLNLTPDKQKEHVEFHMLRGVNALETLIEDSGEYCVGSHITMADLCFVPQMRNVVDRFKVDISNYPKE